MIERDERLRTDLTTRGSLSRQSRIDYIDAVQCLQRKPAISSLSDVPGARSRFDDFSATHIMQTPHGHFSVRCHRVFDRGPIASETPAQFFHRVCSSTSIATWSGSTSEPFKKNAATEVRNRTGIGPYHGKIRENPPSLTALQAPWAATANPSPTALTISQPLASILASLQPPAAAVSTKALL